jgi:glycosyltransferase involved in cell wall biosynthesis
MKTLQIGLGWFPEQSGGLDRVYYDCIRYLPQVDVEANGLVVGSANVALDSGGRVVAFASPKSPLWQRWFRVRQYYDRLISTNDYDLIASHFALYTFPLLDRLGDRPLVIHFHGPWALESSVEGSRSLNSLLKKSLEQITYRRAIKFIVLSQAFRDVLHQEYKIPFDRIRIVPGGVDLEQYNISSSRSLARTELGWNQNRPILFCIRRLAKRMGLENLIAAIDKVRHYHPDILLYIAGKGELAQTLQAQIKELELSEHVHLLGYLAEQQLPLAYRAANFSVVPTLSFEGFGMIAIESLAAGTPVLATPVGGIPEILKPFCEDLLFEGCSVEQLVRGITEALSHQRLLPTSEVCQAYIRENYAWDKIARQIKFVYQETLSN